MDKIAVISDIHGNLPALTAVAEDIRSRGIARIVCLGDLVGKGPQPAETVDYARGLCETIVQGNWDLGITGPQSKEAGIWTRARLGEDRLRFLRELPYCFQITMSGRRIRLFHASAQSVYYRVNHKASRKEKLKMFRNTGMTGAFADGQEPDVVGYGDIHIPFVQSLHRKHRPGVLLFNAGSVGAPYDGIPLASYAILEGAAGEANPAPFTISIVRVPYDIEQVIELAEQLELPQLERFRREMRAGKEVSGQ